MGTEEFMAPEVYRFEWDRKQASIKVAPAQDIYSLGCTLQWVLDHSPSLLRCGRTPYHPELTDICVDLCRGAEEDGGRRVLLKVVKAFCCEKAKDRPTARQALQLVDELLGGWCTAGQFSGGE
jgi:serine/threonine protein kinase